MKAEVSGLRAGIPSKSDPRLEISGQQTQKIMKVNR